MLKINQYFDGKVASIAFTGEKLPATVGVMQVGEYEFATSEFETMTVVSGVLTVKLPQAEEWQTFNQGDTFCVDAGQTFQLKVRQETAYLCTYGELC